PSPDARDLPQPGESEWPKCPACGQRRLTQCPICHTASTHFPPADREFSGRLYPLWICTTCDEPFSPEYARQCEWCGHQFTSGFAPKAAEDQDETDVPVALIAAVVFVALLGLAECLGLF
ncbi:MAG: hypothetical protein ACLQNE_25460, partial [Thermoguttaceae bacterium]